MTAKLIKSNLPGFRGTVHLYELSEPVTFDYEWDKDRDTKNTNYVVVSVEDVLYSGSETYIFPADNPTFASLNDAAQSIAAGIESELYGKKALHGKQD